MDTGRCGDARKDGMTLAHLLTMTSGFDWPEWGAWNNGLADGFGGWFDADNWVDFVLDRELTHAPGEHFNYNTGSTHLLSAVISRATGTSGDAFAREHLFGPLGMDSVVWPQDPQGIPMGGHALQMTAGDAAKFGLLYANGGLWNGEQIVSAEWVQSATSPQSFGHLYIGEYGYLWWIDPGFYFAMGLFGQYVFVAPEQNIVMVVASSYPSDNSTWPIRAFKACLPDAA